MIFLRINSTGKPHSLESESEKSQNGADCGKINEKNPQLSQNRFNQILENDIFIKPYATSCCGRSEAPKALNNTKEITTDNELDDETTDYKETSDIDVPVTENLSKIECKKLLQSTCCKKFTLEIDDLERPRTRRSDTGILGIYL